MSSNDTTPVDTSGAGAKPPLSALTPDNQGAADIIVTYVLIVTTIAFALVRFAVGRQRLLQFDVDDATFLAAVVFAVAVSALNHAAVVAGLGRHQDTLSSHKVNLFFEYAYAINFLAITAMAFAKVSILLLFRRIMSQSRAVQAFVTIATLIGIYFVFSIFATAFQCGASHAWVVQPATCPTHGDMKYGIIGLNMLTDIMLAVWILPSLWKLQMNLQNRLTVISLFGARLIVPFVAVGQLYLTYKALQSEDQTWVQLPVMIVQQVVVHLSVIHATLPRIHGFVTKLQGRGLRPNMGSQTNTQMTASKASGGRRGSGVGPVNTIGSSERGGKSRKVDGRLFVSSSSYDYPLPDEKSGLEQPMDPDMIKPIPEEAEGNFTDGLRLRPDIMPGTKWSTTIYADHESGKERARHNSASTKGEDANQHLQMGTRPDEENSQSSIYDEQHAARAAGQGPSSSSSADNAAAGVPPMPGMPPSHIWKTKEFRMQVEKMQQNGNLVDVTTRENQRGQLGREMTEVA